MAGSARVLGKGFGRRSREARTFSTELSEPQSKPKLSFGTLTHHVVTSTTVTSFGDDEMVLLCVRGAILHPIYRGAIELLHH